MPQCPGKRFCQAENMGACPQPDGLGFGWIRSHPRCHLQHPPDADGWIQLSCRHERSAAVQSCGCDRPGAATLCRGPKLGIQREQNEKWNNRRYQAQDIFVKCTWLVSDGGLLAFLTDQSEANMELVPLANKGYSPYKMQETCLVELVISTIAKMLFVSVLLRPQCYRLGCAWANKDHRCLASGWGITKMSRWLANTTMYIGKVLTCSLHGVC